MKPTLKAPGSKRLKLKYDGPLSNFGFNFNLHRYTKEKEHDRPISLPGIVSEAAPRHERSPRHLPHCMDTPSFIE